VVHEIPAPGGAASTLETPVLAERRIRSEQPTEHFAVRAAVIRRRVASITVEQGSWALLLLLTAFSRFWDLGSRALMHDESIHTYYPWLLYQGDGYTHDPLSHGPFLFHANALVYFLFGDSNATSRFLPALAGILLVAAPWFLRSSRHLGRYGALAAGTFLLLSPALLYYTRFIRHDPYTLVGTIFLVIAIFRFIEYPQRRWLVLGGAMLGFLYTNHEIVFALAAIFAGLLALALLAGPLRPLIPVVAGGGVLGVLVLLLYRASPGRLGGPLPAIPWDSSGPPALQPTPANQRQFYTDLLTHPLILSLLAVLVLTVVAAWLVLRRLTLPDAKQPDADGYPTGWVAVRFRDAAPGTIEAAVRDAWADKVGVQVAVLVAVAIGVTLFTTMFTNLGGLATGTVATDGTLLYWLGQQGVQRGEQPWFYFLVMAPQYELVALGLGLPAIALVLWRGVGVMARRRRFASDPALTFRLFLVGWAAGITLALSYAGEKMPWLIVHIALPLLLLAASLVNELVVRWTASRQAVAAGTEPIRPVARRLTRPGGLTSRWLVPVVAGGLIVLGGAWLLIAARLTSPRFVETRNQITQVIAPANIDDWWRLVVPPIAAVVLIGLAVWFGGATRAARATMAALIIGLLLLQVHAGFRLSYTDGDVARDGLIYNTTTPDVARMASDLERLSYEITGDRSLAIQYGDDVNWPLYWYLRNFSGSFYDGSVDPAADTPVVILPSDDAGRNRDQLSGTYTEQQYVLRWHEPESAIYRNFAIAPELPPGRSAWQNVGDPHGIGAILGSIWDSITTQTTAEGQQRLWRIIFFREMPEPTINFGYSIFIRNDLVPIYNTIHYDEPRS